MTKRSIPQPGDLDIALAAYAETRQLSPARSARIHNILRQRAMAESEAFVLPLVEPLTAAWWAQFTQTLQTTLQLTTATLYLHVA